MTRVPATILVIDDSEAMLSHIKTLLEAAGHTVIATTHARHLWSRFFFSSFSNHCFSC